VSGPCFQLAEEALARAVPQPDVRRLIIERRAERHPVETVGDPMEARTLTGGAGDVEVTQAEVGGMRQWVRGALWRGGARRLNAELG
jgi:hypothetical protein